METSLEINGHLESARLLIGDALSKDSAMVYALISIAESMERQAAAAERQATALEKLTECVSADGTCLDVITHEAYGK